MKKRKNKFETETKIDTQEARRLIDEEGWVLREFRDPFFHFSVTLSHPAQKYPGYTKWISGGILKNLKRLGYKSEIVELPKINRRDLK